MNRFFSLFLVMAMMLVLTTGCGLLDKREAYNPVSVNNYQPYQVTTSPETTVKSTTVTSPSYVPTTNPYVSNDPVVDDTNANFKVTRYSDGYTRVTMKDSGDMKNAIDVPQGQLNPFVRECAKEKFYYFKQIPQVMEKVLLEGKLDFEYSETEQRVYVNSRETNGLRVVNMVVYPKNTTADVVYVILPLVDGATNRVYFYLPKEVKDEDCTAFNFIVRSPHDTHLAWLGIYPGHVEAGGLYENHPGMGSGTMGKLGRCFFVR